MKRADRLQKNGALPANFKPVIITDAGFKISRLTQARWLYVARVRGDHLTSWLRYMLRLIVESDLAVIKLLKSLKYD